MIHQHVSIGLLFNEKNDVLIALRPAHVLAPGLWEFPGGKVELNETPETALIREYHEEIGIEITQAEFLFSIVADDQPLTLHIFRIIHFKGNPQGKEQQEIRFVSISSISHYSFPKANTKVLSFLQSISE